MLDALFNTLDLPGSSVRDVLAGENPFDQWASPFTDDHRTSGARLVSRYVGSNPNSLGTQIAGMGAEMLLDPTNLIGGAGILKRMIGARRAMQANAAADLAEAGRYGFSNPEALARAAARQAGRSAEEVVSPLSGGIRGYLPAPEVKTFAEPFYSNIMEAVEKPGFPKQMDYATLVSRLRKSGVVDEEITDLAPQITAALGKSGRIDSQQLFDIAAENVWENVRFKEMPESVRNELIPFREAYDKAVQAEYDVWKKRYDREGIPDMTGMSSQEREAFWQQRRDQDVVLAEAYLEAEEKTRSIKEMMKEAEASVAARSPTFGSHKVPRGIPGTYREDLIQTPTSGKWASEPHFLDKGGSMSHIRSDDVDLPDGSRAYRLLENQSDLHQEAYKNRIDKMEVDSGILQYVDEAAKQRGEKNPEFMAWAKENADEYPIENFYGPIDREDKLQALDKRFSILTGQVEGLNRQIDRTGGVGVVETSSGQQRDLWAEVYDTEIERDALREQMAELFKTPEVPDTPFKKSWSDLNTKLAVRRAAELGHTKMFLPVGKDIATSVGGPPKQLEKYYDGVRDTLTKLIKKHGGSVRDIKVDPSSLDNLTSTPIKEEWNRRGDILKTGEYVIPEAGINYTVTYVPVFRDHADDYYRVHFDIEGALFGPGSLTAPTLQEAQQMALKEAKSLAMHGKEGTVFELPKSLRDEVLEKGQPLYGKPTTSYADDKKRYGYAPLQKLAKRILPEIADDEFMVRSLQSPLQPRAAVPSWKGRAAVLGVYNGARVTTHE